jgi:hypothetical protein
MDARQEHSGMTKENKKLSFPQFSGSLPGECRGNPGMLWIPDR